MRILDYGFIILGVVWLAMVDWKHMNQTQGAGVLITVLSLGFIMYKMWLTRKR